MLCNFILLGNSLSTVEGIYGGNAASRINSARQDDNNYLLNAYYVLVVFSVMLLNLDDNSVKNNAILAL